MQPLPPPAPRHDRFVWFTDLSPLSGTEISEHVTLRPTLPFPGARGSLAPPSRCASCRPRRCSRPKADLERRASTGRGPGTRRPGSPQGGHRKPAEHFQRPGRAGGAARSLRALIPSARTSRLPGRLQAGAGPHGSRTGESHALTCEVAGEAK